MIAIAERRMTKLDLAAQLRAEAESNSRGES